MRRALNGRVFSFNLDPCTCQSAPSSVHQRIIDPAPLCQLIVSHLMAVKLNVSVASCCHWSILSASKWRPLCENFLSSLANCLHLSDGPIKFFGHCATFQDFPSFQRPSHGSVDNCYLFTISSKVTRPGTSKLELWTWLFSILKKTRIFSTECSHAAHCSEACSKVYQKSFVIYSIG